MPPEPAPWDRKESSAASRGERKHERPPPDAGGGGGQFPGGARWRDSHRGPREFYSPSPRRPPPGHHKQAFAEEAPSRSEDEGFRCHSGRYGSSSGRDGAGRGYLRRSPWSPADGAHAHHGSPTGCGAQRSVAAAELPKAAVSPSAAGSSSPFVSLRDRHGRPGGDGVDDASGTGRRQDREPDRPLGSIAWKPLKWPRSGTFPPPPPPSSSAKPVGSEPDDRKPEAPPVSAGKASPVPSQADSLLVAEDGNPRKKQRLGWGQGLAKYEKEKVEGPEVNSTTPTGMQQGGSGSGSGAFATEPRPNLPTGDGAGLDSLASPRVGYSGSLPASEDKLPVTVEVSIPKKDASVSLVLIPENILPDVSADIEDLDVNSLSRVSSFIVDLLSAEDNSAMDLSSMRQSSLDKLLLLKGEISKLIEKTEAVIDLCEIELKNLNGQDDKTDKTTALQQVDCMHTDKIDSTLVSSASIVRASQHGFGIANSEEIHSHNVSGVEKRTLHATDVQSTVEFASCPDGKLLVGNTDKKEEDSHVPVPTNTVAQVVSSPCFEDLSLSTRIMESNRDSARKASEIFDEFSACTISPHDVLENDKASSTHIKEKLMVRKCSLRFKERALTLKFKALHHLWREDLRLLDLLSAKKNASKLQKRCEVRCQFSQNGQQKPRSSSRSRLLGPASNKALLPTGEILDLTSQLISDSEIHIFRKNLKMPAMILDDSERMHSRFVTKNGFIEDPIMVEKEKSLINPWAEEEQAIFMEKLKMFGKDFRKIATFLDHKTTADCIEFYYKNHKLESFEAVRKSLGSRKQSHVLSSSNYMVASGKKWKNEPNTTSLDVLGAVSAIVSHSYDVKGARQKFSGKSIVGSSTVLKMSRGNCGRMDIDGVAETTAADVLAGIGSAMSSEGVSSCVTSSIDPSEKVESLPVDCIPFAEVSHAICEEDAYSDEACGELDLIDWSDDEKSVFIRAFRLYGKDFSRIALCLGTRSREQCKAFFSKARRCLGLDMIYQGTSTNAETPLSDVNGGRSDTDEACATEMDSTMCSTRSFSRVDTDWSCFRMKFNSQEATPKEKCFPAVVPVKLDEMFDAGDTKDSSETCGEKLYSVLADKDIQFPNNSLNQFASSSGDLAGAHLNCISEVLDDRRAADDDLNAQDADLLVTKSGILSVPVEGNGLNVNDAVEMGSGRFRLDLSDAEPVTQLANESLIHRETKLLAKNHIDANVVFDTASHAGNACQEKYGNIFLDAIFDHVPQMQQGVNLPPRPKKSHVISWKQKDNTHSSSKPILQDSNKSIIFGGHDQVPSLPANFMFEGGKKRHSVQGKDRQPHMPGNHFLPGVDQTGHVLRGYPLHLLNMKDLEYGDLLYQKPVSGGNMSKKNGSTHSSQFFAPNFHADKFGKVRQSVPEPVYARNTEESAEMPLRPCSQDTSIETGQKSTRTGDVKLFGKILSHPSPVPKPDSTEVIPPSTKEKRILNFRFPNGDTDGTYDPSNAEASAHLGLAAEFSRGYDWLDGNKVQTCFSSLGNSALCLSKCPPVLSGVAFHPKKVKPVNTGGILVHRGLFPADGKGQLVFPDLQNRARIDGRAGFQQPARVAVNMAGAMEALGCTVITDPVAALRLHFAKQMAPLCSSEDSQRGDLGSR